MQNFSYHAPATLGEACALMAEAPDRSRFLAGGSDLHLALEHHAGPVDTVIDLKRIAGLEGIEETPGGGWRIGALTRMAALERHQGLRAALPALCAAAAVVGGPPIRNRATLGGNLCNASPAADTATPLLAFGAQVEVSGGGVPGSNASRTLALEALWAGPRSTTLRPEEVLTAVVIPPPPTGGGANESTANESTAHGNAFARLTRSAMDIALVNAAASLTLDGSGRLASLTVALGAVGATVLSVPGTDALLGRPVDEALLEDIGKMAETAAQPITDVRASAEYRREMAGVMAMRAVGWAAAPAKGDTP
ncbi:MAG: xanthine dehydrogenase family protein subunit M [SAR324 cluster bacterium]|nr:xanthine dehydrogenase family protein subunit M [SAR324 cluster bacterium]MCH8886089.1 xanthine dehydrogenase family protein subunit M [SAR324 cluster bacterium]